MDLAPGRDLGRELVMARDGTRQQLGTALSAIVPKRLAQAWLADSEIAQILPAMPGLPAASERRIAELAAAYIRRHRLEDQSVRIDVVAVTFPAGPGGQPVVEHYQNAFDSPW